MRRQPHRPMLQSEDVHTWPDSEVQLGPRIVCLLANNGRDRLMPKNGAFDPIRTFAQHPQTQECPRWTTRATTASVGAL
jgi:hypothetical protein